MIAAQLLAEDQVLFLGEDFLPWMVLAFGAALVVGNVLALVRPPTPEGSTGRAGDDAPKGARSGTSKGTAAKGGTAKGGTAKGSTDDGGAPIARPPMVRTVAMIVVGLVAAAWGLASLLA